MREGIISIGFRIKKQRLAKQELELESKRLEQEHKMHRKEDTLRKLKEVRLRLDEALS